MQVWQTRINGSFQEPLILLVQTKKVISMKYGSSASGWKPWRWVMLDLVFTVRDHASILNWTHSQNSLAAAEAPWLKIFSHGTSPRWWCRPKLKLTELTKLAKLTEHIFWWLYIHKKPLPKGHNHNTQVDIYLECMEYCCPCMEYCCHIWAGAPMYGILLPMYGILLSHLGWCP